MTGDSAFLFGEHRRARERPIGAAHSRVGAFPHGDGTLRIQRFDEHEGVIIVDPTQWIAAQCPADLGRWA